MTEATKRRGRPPGSKNRPKPEQVPLAAIPVEPEPGWQDEPESLFPDPMPEDGPVFVRGLAGSSPTNGPDWKPGDTTRIEEAGYAEGAPLLESLTTTIKVALQLRQAMGDAYPEQVVDWPATWRLPLQGERILLRDDWAGIVQTIDYDLARQMPIIHLR